MTTMSDTVLLIGGRFDRHRVRLSATPPRIEVGGEIGEQITDPDTGAFLGAYAFPYDDPEGGA
jgi:hypothetical protein